MASRASHDCARRLRRAVGFSLLIAGVVPAVGAFANSGVGIGAATGFRARFTTDHTAAPSGLVLNTSGRLPAPGVLEAPAVRQTVILPQGTQLRLGRLPQCHASDAAIAAEGAEGACPRSSRVGSGQADGVLAGSSADFALAIYAVRGHLVFAAEQGHKPLKQSFTGVSKGHTLILTVPTLDGRITPTSFAATIAARPGGRRWLLTPPTCPSSGHWRTAGRFQGASAATPTAAADTPARTLYERVPCR
jgi:hypothetical protein